MAKKKSAPKDYAEVKAELTAEYIGKGLEAKEAGGKKKIKADSDNPLYREYRAKLAAARRPAWVT